MKKKVFTIGGATVDLFVKTDQHAIMTFKTKDQFQDWIGFDYGAKVPVNELLETFGGGGMNTAVGFSKMGFESYFIGKVGSTHLDSLFNYLQKQKVGTEFIKTTSKEKTGFSVILNSFEGDRTVLTYAGANRLFSKSDLPLESLKSADWIFLNHLAKSKSKIPSLLESFLVQNSKIKMAWNPGKEQLSLGCNAWKSLLSSTEVLILNKEEASLFSGKKYRLAGMNTRDPKHYVKLPAKFLPPYADDVCEIMMELLKTGVKNVVITDGRNGAQATDGQFIYFCPVITADRTDTLGAGDAFSTGFITALIEGKNLKSALKYGTLNANSAVQKCGAQNGLLDRSEISKRLKDTEISITKAKLF